MSPVTSSRRVAIPAALFGAALVCLALASITHEVWPLFLAWIPLVAVPWFLTRPEAGRGDGDAQPAGTSESEPSDEADAGGAEPGESETALPDESNPSQTAEPGA